MQSFLIALLMDFGNLEKRKHTNFLEKHHAGAHAIIEQKPYGTSLTRLVDSLCLLHTL